MADDVSGAHAKDLELARACAGGDAAAWDRFVLEFRPVLYRATDALDATGGAREIADALYGELYSKSLFKYFHGRSSLATWLRALVAQRYVDRYRASRRLDQFPEDDTIAAPGRSDDSPLRSRYLAVMQAVLTAAIAVLKPKDRLRLRCYYSQEMTLAQIGRVTREHEATVSRQLARTRQQLGLDVKERLRRDHHLSADEVRECIASVVDDSGTLDLGVLLNERKKVDAERSIAEGVS
jgi:RNA polymerase sigma factor (sigma-70 family)